MTVYFMVYGMQSAVGWNFLGLDWDPRRLVRTNHNKTDECIHDQDWNQGWKPVNPTIGEK